VEASAISALCATTREVATKPLRSDLSATLWARQQHLYDRDQPDSEHKVGDEQRFAQAGAQADEGGRQEVGEVRIGERRAQVDRVLGGIVLAVGEAADDLEVQRQVAQVVDPAGVQPIGQLEEDAVEDEPHEGDRAQPVEPAQRGIGAAVCQPGAQLGQVEAQALAHPGPGDQRQRQQAGEEGGQQCRQAEAQQPGEQERDQRIRRQRGAGTKGDTGQQRTLPVVGVGGHCARGDQRRHDRQSDEHSAPLACAETAAAARN
jgi:hypothetical protein